MTKVAFLMHKTENGYEPILRMDPDQAWVDAPSMLREGKYEHIWMTRKESAWLAIRVQPFF